MHLMCCTVLYSLPVCQDLNEWADSLQANCVKVHAVIKVQYVVQWGERQTLFARSTYPKENYNHYKHCFLPFLYV